MNYCIGCVHLYYQPSEEGYRYSSWTYSPGSPAELSCQKGHWRERLESAFTQEKFQEAMASAATCKDFTERPDPLMT